MAEERKCHVPLSHFQFAPEELELGMQTAIGEVCVMLGLRFCSRDMGSPTVRGHLPCPVPLLSPASGTGWS